MNIIFFGSDDFALAHLESLIASSHKILACVTQPDKARGRGLNVGISGVKSCSKENHIPVFQPQHLNDKAFLEEMRRLESDLFVVIAYGKFLPAPLLKIPKIFAINLHGSFLPKHRGAAPINWAIINGEKESGLSIIRINEEMDAGDVLAQVKIDIEQKDTAGTLRTKMTQLGPAFLLKTIEALDKKKFTLTAQNSNNVSFAPKLTKDLGHINWNKSADEIHNLIRGLSPSPSAYTFYKGKRLKILLSEVVKGYLGKDPSAVTSIEKNGFTVAAGQNGLLVKVVHLESSKEMDAYSFVQGRGLNIGDKFK